MSYVEPRGKGKFRLNVTIGTDEKGYAIRERKTVTAKNITEARKILSDFEAEVNSGHYLKPTDITLKQFHPKWKEYIEGAQTPATRASNEQIMDNRILPKYGHMKLSTIKPMHIFNFVNELKKDGRRMDKKKGKLSASTVRNCYKTFHSILQCAVNLGVIKENPADGVKPPKLGKSQTDVYSKEEIIAMIEALEHVQQRWKLLIMIAFTVGAREGEISALEWKHIDTKNHTIRIEQSLSDEFGLSLKNTTKTDRDRIVKMPTALSDLFDEYHKRKTKVKNIVPYDIGDGKVHLFIFSDLYGKPIRPDSISQWWRRFTKKYKLRHIRFHDLRHTSATFLINENVQSKIISSRLGHSNIQTTMNVYGHFLEEADEGAVEHFDQFLQEKKAKGKQ
ncbi:tyrosine-type recombinase/integrase [Sporolactobacillus kofuensis]|uniref:Tyrosine-type recombinase/integrase n=1 Tax=Sporolactobacillus kofuensis TaxID=269672 RepID=A0ABW1W9L1_9BACL|nr:site-specific integrase [Sporolactobacillus kofuensis]MCO7177056.1 site-specific integrase [Sporolactobacillus kofuensis]